MAEHTARGAAAYTALDVAALLGRPAPTPEQVAVIEAPLEPVCVVAGAGSGKTETMAARVVHLVVNGLVAPERVLGLTFTRKAAGELSARVRARLRTIAAALHAAGRPVPWERDTAGFAVPTIATYNAYAAGLVRDHALRVGIEPGARLLGEAARWQLAHRVVESWPELATDRAVSSVVKDLLQLAGEVAEHLLTPDEVRAECERLAAAVRDTPPGEKDTKTRLAPLTRIETTLAYRAALVPLVEELTRCKRAADQIDFADQVAVAARLARTVPEVGAGERGRWGVVLLDEYQDTSVAQIDLLAHLFGGRGGGAGHPVTAVGDPHQAIYGWRGASDGALERFTADFPGGSPAPLTLSVSWRNDEAVLAAANAVSADLRRRAANRPGGGIDLPVLRPRPGSGTGRVVAAYLETDAAEAEAVADFVVERRDRLRAERAATGDPAPVSSAVLCRTRRQFLAHEVALRRRGLPVEVVGLGGLLAAPEVVDLVAALEAAHDPSRGDSLMRLLTGPRARLGLADLAALGAWARELAARRTGPGPDAAGAGGPGGPEDPGEVPVEPESDVVDERSIVDALDRLPPPGWRSRDGRAPSAVGRARLATLAGTLRALRRLTHLPLVELVGEAERLLDLDVEVQVTGGVAGEPPGAARARLDAFRSVAGTFAADDDHATLGAFLAWLGAAQEHERGLDAPVGPIDPHAVQILTVHAAKGLEWDVVAVPGLVAGDFPGKPQQGWPARFDAVPGTLRGDRQDLPALGLAGAADNDELLRRLGRYEDEHAAHRLAEDRRLAYVAVTRARADLMVSGFWWRDTQQPGEPSVFLTEVAAVGEVERGEWATDPRLGDDGTEVTPVKPEPAGPTADGTWPVAAPLGERQELVESVARAVEAARTELRATGPAAEDGPLPGPISPVSPAVAELADLAALLLAEERVGRGRDRTVALPPHLSASAAVRLAADREAFALQLRRPVPLEPSEHARRGTAFHGWVEQYFGAPALLDVDALPGADDESATGDERLEELRATFLASQWAGRAPVDVEVDVELTVAGVALRCRIDAVFAEGDGYVVVDWKTGRPPSDPAESRAREIQLAVYRLAWARARGLDPDRVGAAFYYVGSGRTVRPAALADEAELTRLLTAAG